MIAIRERSRGSEAGRPVAGEASSATVSSSAAWYSWAADRRPNPRPNPEIADRLERIADLLSAQDGEPFRIRAYRAAADTLRSLSSPVGSLLEEGGRPELERLPTVGRSISALIEEYVETGRIGLLERLEGHVSPKDVLCRVPGIGEVLAARIHEELGVETLEELELAAHDGRLENVRGFGPRRIAAIKAVLESRLGRRRSGPGERGNGGDGAEGVGRAPDVKAPPVSVLLAVDERYRTKAAAGELRTIAPRRFNPSGRAWLPILHTSIGEWQFTALYSNTALAHRLGRTRDWVVIYYERNGDEGQCTVVTEFQGLLEGWRVVRGRESECLGFYSETHGWAWAPETTSRAAAGADTLAPAGRSGTKTWP